LIPAWGANRLTRLRLILRLRTPFAADLACLRTGQAWLLEADAVLSASAGGEPQTAEQQIMAFATWRDRVARRSHRLPPPYAQCLAHFIGVLTRMQPHRFAWMSTAGLPRINNDLERFIRAMKTR
jgi:hypothetical protein